MRWVRGWHSRQQGWWRGQVWISGGGRRGKGLLYVGGDCDCRHWKGHNAGRIRTSLLPTLFLGWREGYFAPRKEGIFFTLVEADMVCSAATAGKTSRSKVPGEAVDAAGRRGRWVPMAAENIFETGSPDAVGQWSVTNVARVAVEVANGDQGLERSGTEVKLSVYSAH